MRWRGSVCMRETERYSSDSRNIAACLYSVGSYVIPWESHVNYCHLHFSCSEFYADSQNQGVTRQNDRNCLGNMIKFEKNEITFWNPSRAIFCLLEAIFRSTIAKLSNMPISSWVRIGHDALLTHTNFFWSFVMFKTWNEMLPVKQ